ncbi:uncharacterized protein LOC126704237 [Quercus robur]|uniref:uncharacterized protein LOC126704237 n=1 Tax=Quercus robur TaxID=38942 RepID=UPI0021623530|nr:uncharacterized protein LOC126704237 [Quercus robur]
MEADENSDSERSDLREGLVAVPFSKELKARIRTPWSKSLIVKVYDRAIGFSFLYGRLLSLWKPVGKLDCVDLGQEFFLVRFSIKEDCKAVLRNDPWFIGENFLSIRPWEPNFKPAEANISSVAIWVRLNELPIEYYHVEALQLIGSALGKVLRLDTHTASESRGRFARLCIQVDVGRIGHRRENCPYVVRNDDSRARETGEKKDVPANQGDDMHVLDNAGSTSGMSLVDSEKAVMVDSEKDVYGPWIRVTRRRHGNKATKNLVPTNLSTHRTQGVDNVRPTDVVHREGKRKVVMEHSPFEAQMANVVRSISNRPNHTSQSVGQSHVESYNPVAKLSLSIRGKKGIARSRASLIGTNKEAVNHLVKGAATSVRSSFLNKQSANGNATFNFKADSLGQPSSSSPNGQPSCLCQEKYQPKVQAVMEARDSFDTVEERDGESSLLKANPGRTETFSREQVVCGNNVVVMERLGTGHGVAEQMDFEEGKGVGPTSL